MFNPLSRHAVDERLLGVIGPLVTTFDSRGDTLSLPAFSANIRAHIRAGQCGVLVGGSTGEAALLDEYERSSLVETGRAAVPADAAFLVGVGGESTKLTIKRAREAAARGADAVLVVSPHYYTSAMNTAALRSHHRAVAEESPVPVLLYNIPKYTHFVLEPSLVAELSEHQNVIGIKDSSGDLELLRKYVEVQKANQTFTVLTGNGPTFAPSLKSGARGGILAVALFTGDVAPQIFDAFKAGDVSRADELQSLITHAGKEIVGVMGVPGVKAAMDLAGLHGGMVRSPLQPLGEAGQESIRSMLAQIVEAQPRAASASLV